MNRTRLIPLLAMCGVVCAGCVDRRIFITSEPSGATVFLNDAEMGQTPLEVNFTYFGIYDVRLRREGYEPLVTQAEAKAPFHELPVIDFFALMVPGTKRTHIDWHFELEAADTDEAALLERAQQMRRRFEEPDEGEEDAAVRKPQQ